MNLTKLIHNIWKDERTRELKIRKDEVKILVHVFLDHIGRGLIQYGKLKLKGLFTLEIREAKGRRIKNPQTKEDMYSKDYYKIGIIPSKSLKNDLSNLKDKK